MRPNQPPRGTRRGSPQLRLRVGFLVIAMALSIVYMIRREKTVKPDAANPV